MRGCILLFLENLNVFGKNEKSNIIFNHKELHECHLNATLLKIIMNYFSRYYLKLCCLAISN
jgi:hypothetical protein